MSNMDEAAREWLAARQVIVDFLRELRPDLFYAEAEHNAAALLARLANHEPPILVSFYRPEGADDDLDSRRLGC
jgi:hypothetical protein